MATNYSLVNFTKKDRVIFASVGAGTARELAGNQASSAITTWYLLRNLGDEISFVSDTNAEWPFRSGTINDLQGYTEVTERVLAELIEQGILKDFGRLYEDPDDPSRVFIRDLRNVWLTA